MDEDKIKPWIQWISRDFVYLMLVMMMMIYLFYQVADMQEYQNECNEYWTKQVDKRYPSNTQEDLYNFTEAYTFNAIPII